MTCTASDSESTPSLGQLQDYTELQTQYDFGSSDMLEFLTPPSTPAYVCVTNCNNSIFVNMKQFSRNEMTGMYSSNGEITLSMADFSALMLTLRSIENKLSTDNSRIRASIVNLGEKPSKKSRKSKI